MSSSQSLGRNGSPGLRVNALFCFISWNQSHSSSPPLTRPTFSNMRLFNPLLAIAALTTSSAAFTKDAQSDDPNTISIYAWPLTATEPVPVAVVKLSHSPDSDAPSASIFRYSPPSISSSQDETVRIGILDPVTKKWTGSAVATDAFQPEFDRKFQLHLDEATKRIWHVSLSTSKVPVPVKEKSKDKKAKAKTDKAGGKKEPLRKGETTVEVVTPWDHPEPILNKPVQLNLDGRAPEAPEEQKSFLQKYVIH
ncbi:hypothetical protein BT63DRAFT_110511 [Microthyrium microscopicum]|uniref:Uncharacterized protein n=1 Tax=Microthyrium microscopicum TaxID=703497 RepID=A0A6A6TV64_9PEZI|nr:hypothetical protein BT63DRAFT_110511 [Microthyrium microscopicum]